MPLIDLTTRVHAPIERCFDLARSIDFHVVTTAKTQETPIDGRTSGLIGLNETVTWRAKHLGLWRKLTVKITVFDRPRHFQDVMTKGVFASMKHDHLFAARDGTTFMVDKFIYQSPLGPIGTLADHLFLRRYMHQLLAERARILKTAAESDEWRKYLEAE